MYESDRCTCIEMTNVHAKQSEGEVDFKDTEVLERNQEKLNTLETTKL